jgi:hypothetical protein
MGSGVGICLEVKTDMLQAAVMGDVGAAAVVLYGAFSAGVQEEKEEVDLDLPTSSVEASISRLLFKRLEAEVEAQVETTLEEEHPHGESCGRHALVEELEEVVEVKWELPVLSLSLSPTAARMNFFIRAAVGERERALPAPSFSYTYVHQAYGRGARARLLPQKEDTATPRHHSEDFEISTWTP